MGSVVETSLHQIDASAMLFRADSIVCQLCFGRYHHPRVFPINGDDIDYEQREDGRNYYLELNGDKPDR